MYHNTLNARRHILSSKLQRLAKGSFEIFINYSAFAQFITATTPHNPTSTPPREKLLKRFSETFDKSFTALHLKIHDQIDKDHEAAPGLTQLQLLEILEALIDEKLAAIARFQEIHTRGWTIHQSFNTYNELLDKEAKILLAVVLKPISFETIDSDSVKHEIQEESGDKNTNSCQ
jgi:hypothetical protein